MARTTCIRKGCKEKLPELALTADPPDPYCSNTCCRLEHGLPVVFGRDAEEEREEKMPVGIRCEKHNEVKINVNEGKDKKARWNCRRCEQERAARRRLDPDYRNKERERSRKRRKNEEYRLDLNRRRRINGKKQRDAKRAAKVLA